MYTCAIWACFRACMSGRFIECCSRCRPVEAATSSLTNAQLTEHYADCIKLSTQNVCMHRHCVELCVCMRVCVQIGLSVSLGVYFVLFTFLCS